MRSQPPFLDIFCDLVPAAGPDTLRQAWRRLLTFRAEAEALEIQFGRWEPDPDLDPSLLLDAVRDAESHPLQVYKDDAFSRVFRADLLGRDTVVKVCRPPSGVTAALKQRFRPGRARRAWAAGLVLHRAGLPVPEPLGCLEMKEGFADYSLTAALPETINGRRWIKPRFHRQALETREGLSRLIADRLLDLYRRHIYHADTKALNFLLLHPEQTGTAALYWIDLEGVRFGYPPTRRRVLRNLVQLNGSVGSNISLEDRRAFLHLLADDFPWLLEPQVEQVLRRRTLQRLRRELNDGVTP